MFERERDFALEVVRKACYLCRAVQKDLVAADTLTKKDRSPVTVADLGVQALVSLALREAFPDDPLVGEEDSSVLEGDENAAVRDEVLSRVHAFRPGLGEADLLRAIDRGDDLGGARGRFWTIDPIDGTKGFLRGEQYAVALALLVDGKVEVGVLGCTELPISYKDENSPRGSILSAVRGQGSWQTSLEGDARTRLSATALTDPAQAVFCESVEKAHSAHDDSEKVAELLGVGAEPLRIDSQCKYAVLARGDVSIYLRLPTRKDYREKIWDHAAGAIVVEEAGGTVSDVDGKPLDFSLGRRLEGNAGIVAASRGIHEQVVRAVREALGR